MKTRYFSYLLTISAISLVACDCIEDEFGSGETTRTVRLVTVASRSTVMDVKQIFRNVMGVDLASCGGSHVNYINDRYVLYDDDSATPSAFSFGVLHTNNSRTDVDVILARQDAAFTRFTMTNNEVLVVNLLNNPELAHYDPFAKSVISVETNRPGDVYANDRNVVIEVSSIEKVGSLVNLRYSPPTGFIGQVKFRYYVTVDVESGLAPCNLPQAPEFYSAHDVVIEVVE